MTRIPDDNTQTIRRYNASHSPPNEKTAKDTVELLRGEEISIQTRLEQADPKTFVNQDAYATWRRRTIDALSHTRTELRYLERWLEQQASARIARERSVRNPDLATIANQIRVRAQVLAAQIGGQYKPVYTPSSLPADPVAAHARVDLLTTMKMSLQEAFTEIIGAWTQHPLRRDDLSGVKGPLQKLLSRVESELLVLKGYLRAQAQTEQSQRSEWKAVCAQALTRAKASGFELTSDEERVHNWLLAKSQGPL